MDFIKSLILQEKEDIDKSLSNLGSTLDDLLLQLDFLKEIKVNPNKVLENEGLFKRIFNSFNDDYSVLYIALSYIKNGLFDPKYLNNEIFSQSIVMKNRFDEFIDSRILLLNEDVKAEEHRYFKYQEELKENKTYADEEYNFLDSYNEDTVIDENNLRIISNIISDYGDYIDEINDMLRTINVNYANLIKKNRNKKSEITINNKLTLYTSKKDITVRDFLDDNHIIINDLVEFKINGNIASLDSTLNDGDKLSFVRKIINDEKPVIKKEQKKEKKDVIPEKNQIALVNKKLKTFIDRFHKTADILSRIDDKLPIYNTYVIFIEKIEEAVNNNEIVNEQNYKNIDEYLSNINPSDLSTYEDLEPIGNVKTLLRCLTIHQYIKKLSSKKSLVDLSEYFSKFMYDDFMIDYEKSDGNDECLFDYLTKCGFTNESLYIEELLGIKSSIEAKYKKIDDLLIKYKKSSFRFTELIKTDGDKFDYSQLESHKENILKMFSDEKEYFSVVVYSLIDDINSVIRDYQITPDVFEHIKNRKLLLDQAISMMTYGLKKVTDSSNKGEELVVPETVVSDETKVNNLDFLNDEDNIENYFIFLDEKEQKKVIDKSFDEEAKSSALSKLKILTVKSQNDIFTKTYTESLKNTKCDIHEYRGKKSKSRLGFKFVDTIRYKGKPVVLIPLAWSLNNKDYYLDRCIYLYESNIKDKRASKITDLEEKLIAEFKKGDTKLIKSKIEKAHELCHLIYGDSPRVEGQTRGRKEK
ncbi:MAG: hypothetical protein J5634_00035 [Bacilli bacterium]|nr:hypothetical protein [Bacilli bacterium]